MKHNYKDIQIVQLNTNCQLSAVLTAWIKIVVES